MMGKTDAQCDCTCQKDYVKQWPAVGPCLMRVAQKQERRRRRSGREEEEEAEEED